MPERRPDRGVFDKQSIQRALRKYDRTPFIDLLTDWVEHAPSGEALENFANEKPGAYVAAMRQLAHLAGYIETTHIDLTASIDVNRMSDSQLEDRFRELAKKAGIEAPALFSRVVEAVVNPTAPEPSATALQHHEQQQEADAPKEQPQAAPNDKSEHVAPPERDVYGRRLLRPGELPPQPRKPPIELLPSTLLVNAGPSRR